MTRDETKFYVPMYSRDVSEPRASPSRLKLEERKRLFAGINVFVRKHGDGWLTSIPGDREVTMETLPGSTLAAELEKLGYRLDATGKTAPREIIHLLNSAREQEVARIERGEDAPSDDIIFDHTVFKPALATVSEARLVQTIYAEYPELKPWLTDLEGEKTEQTLESLSAIWKTSEDEAARRTQTLVEIGFFQERESGGLATFWVPFSIETGCL